MRALGPLMVQNCSLPQAIKLAKFGTLRLLLSLMISQWDQKLRFGLEMLFPL